MVCVYYGPHGERLIRRGIQISELLGAPLYVLTVDSEQEERQNSYGREMYVSVWKRMAKDAGAEFIERPCRGRRISEVIVEAALEKEVTQIVIGQSGQSRWEEITKGNFINELIGRMGLMDLHIVAVQRLPDQLEETHEDGFTAYLVKNGADYELSDEPSGGDSLKGVFFRELHTDFNNGLFKIEQEDGPRYLEIRQGTLRGSRLN